MLSNHFVPAARTVLLSTGIAFASLVSPAHAAVVSVTKDCSMGPCTVTGTTTNIGRFNLSASSFNWEALYLGTVKNFYVSQSGINAATTRINTAAGDTMGTGSLAKGTWFIGVSTFLMGAGTYSVYGSTVVGDPHIATTNGVHYDFQGAGEFVLLKRGADFEVQSRMTPVSTAGPGGPEPRTELSTCVSINTAAAVKTEKHRVTYEPRIDGRVDPSGMQLRVDGRLLRDVPQRGKRLDDGATIFKEAATGIVRVEYRDETSVRLVPNWWASQKLWYLDFDMSPPDAAVGIAGPIGADDWIPALADGKSAGPKPGETDERYKALYGRFADSWRVADDSTLFDYAKGKATGDFTVGGWPRLDGKCSLPGTKPLPEIPIEVARRVCSAVTVPHLQRACLQDVTATGDKVFGKSYEKMQGPVKSKARVPYRPEG